MFPVFHSAAESALDVQDSMISMRNRTRNCLVVAGLTVTAFAVLLGSFVRRQLLGVKQIRNLELFRLSATTLDEYYKAHGSFPCILSDATSAARWKVVRDGDDYWDFPVRYESRGQSFVLVSYGRDGRSDHLDYWHLRELNDNSPRARNICFAWDADQVMSDRGFHRCCGK